MSETGNYLMKLVPMVLFCLTVAVPVSAQNPYEMKDYTWLSIDGTVEQVRPDTFTLNYGDGEIIVEMDDGDRDADAYKLVRGDKVRISGRIDKDFFQTTTIEASSVYVEKLDTYFYASSADEEERYAVLPTPIVVADIVAQGTVLNVGKDRFTLDTGAETLDVYIGAMEHNPLDDRGYLRVERGDLVRVSGQMNSKLFSERVLIADQVTEIGD